MGRLVADAGKRDWRELTAEYGAQLMGGLGVMGSRGKHVNVLQQGITCKLGEQPSPDSHRSRIKSLTRLCFSPAEMSWA
jgi:hypothetical protein